MSVKNIPCRDVKKIKNGTTTIVENEMYVNFTDDFYRDLSTVEYLGAPRETIFGAKGVSKLHPDDTYDEETGRIIASKKAEIKANKLVQKYLGVMKECLENMLAEVTTDLARLDNREKSLSSSLDR